MYMSFIDCCRGDCELESLADGSLAGRNVIRGQNVAESFQRDTVLVDGSELAATTKPLTVRDSRLTDLHL